MRPHSVLLAVLKLIVGMAVASTSSAIGCGDYVSTDDSGKFYANRIASSRFFEIELQNREATLKKLGNPSFMKIDRAAVMRISKIPSNFDNNKGEIYLVRVRRATSRGGFGVFSSGSRLLVLHTDLGSTPCEETFWSVIAVATKIKITAVLSAASIAQ